MYSKYSDKSDPDIRIPEHYSGCAFSNVKKAPAPYIGKNPSTFLEVGTPTPPSPPTPPLQKFTEQPVAEEKPVFIDPPQEITEPIPTEAATEKKQAIPTLGPLSGLFGNIGSAFPFSHGIGFEELLILGMIILLSRNEGESDIVLLLGLLLFCG